MSPTPLALLATFVVSLVVAASAAAATDDGSLRRAVLGTWLHEQSAGVASVAMFTTYREDGTAIQLLKTKIVFRPAKAIYIENRWRIENGTLFLTPVRFRAQDEAAQIELTEAARSALTITADRMTYQLKGKTRPETKVDRLPADVQALIDELSKP